MSNAGEQAEAAQRETRSLMDAILPGHHRGQGLMPSWAAQMFQLTHETPRCRHLASRPVQPWFAHMWEGIWRCRACIQERVASGVQSVANPIEDGTCDRCRRFVGGDQLTLLILRQDLWVLDVALCPDCARFATANGADEYWA